MLVIVVLHPGALHPDSAAVQGPTSSSAWAPTTPTWNVGLHFKIPFIERVAKVVSLKEQVADFQPQPVITKDNVTMQIDTVVYFQITDPMLYTYGIERPLRGD